MTLQVRRGTDAERLSITPASGEPIWTTDTTQLYVGDGITPGGVAVGSGGGSISTVTDQSLFTTSSVEFASVGINAAYTLPTADGTAGQVLKTDGSGTVVFGTVSAANITGLAAVATSGAYADLSGGPNQALNTNSNVTFNAVTLTGLQVAQINTAGGLSLSLIHI